MQCLGITTYLPIIFILRHDQQSLVKKKAYDVWKTHVFNTNKELKNIYNDLLEFIKFKNSKTFCYALKGMVSEMSLKYSNYLESYIKATENDEIKEFIFIEVAKNNKFMGLASEFCKIHFNTDLFNIISKKPSLRDEIPNNIDKGLH